jgi:tRNA-specific 2-thiouridylase
MMCLLGKNLDLTVGLIILTGCEGMMKNSGHVNVGPETKTVKAIAAMSGGLDSIVAAALVKGLGIDVILLHVQHFFCASEKKCAWLQQIADRLGLPLRIVDASIDHLETVRRPKYGYGKGMNPCVDCRIFLLQVAKRVMEEEGAQFVITGEVLGQRPKSQHHRELMRVAEESGLGNRLLRPLSANLLPDTLPVVKGWLRKEDLLSIQGRSRQQQMTLAAELGITEYPQPAGGCVLTERVYAARLRDAFDHLGRDAVDLEQFRLLRCGRHFRVSERAKAIIGRNESENEALAGLAEGRIRVDPAEVMGPTTLIEGDPTEEELRLVASLAARYCDAEEGALVAFDVRDQGSRRRIEAAALDRDDPRIAAWRIG